MPEQNLRQMARLLQLHKETNEDCIGRRFGVTGEYVRQVWARMYKAEMASLDEAIETFYGSVK